MVVNGNKKENHIKVNEVSFMLAAKEGKRRALALPDTL